MLARRSFQMCISTNIFPIPCNWPRSAAATPAEKPILAFLNSQTHKYLLPSNEIILRVALITKYGCVARCSEMNHIPWSLNVLPTCCAPLDFQVIFFRMCLIWDNLFSPYCQYYWAESMAHITSDLQELLVGLGLCPILIGRFEDCWGHDWLVHLVNH